MLYAVGEIAVFMVGATIIGFLIGRLTKRSAHRPARRGDDEQLEATQAALRELEAERTSLRGQLMDAKERVRQLAAEPTAGDVSETTEELEREKRALEEALQAAEAQAGRLRATITDRDHRIAELTSGRAPEPDSRPIAPLGYSSSAGTLADTRIVFDEEDDS